MSNKLLNKFLLPYYISAGLCITASGITIGFVPKNSKLAKIVYQDEYYSHSDTNYFICIVVIMILLLMSGGFFSISKEVHRKANHITKKYLRNVFAQHPELKQYEFVLHDKQKLKEIATIACNSLSQEEQKQILEIMKDAIERPSKQENSHKVERQKIKNAEKDILTIVKQHEKANPEFIKDILSVFSQNHSVFVLSMNERTR